MRILFMGSPDFALPSLDELNRHYDISAVITQPDRRAGRGRTIHESAVKRRAITYELEVVEPDTLRDQEVYSELASLRPDLIVVAAYGQILPGEILDLPTYGSINVHASLLPRWRGAAPVQAAILEGDEQTGVTIMKMDAGLDTGPLLSQTSTPIGGEETGGELGKRLAEIGAHLLIDTISEFVSGEIVPSPQDDANSTYAPALEKANGKLNPKLGAVRLARQVRAFEPWPSSFFHWNNLRIVVRKARSHTAKATQIGKVLDINGQPAIATTDGSLILEKIQPAGKREMRARDFLNGSPDFIGAQVLA